MRASTWLPFVAVVCACRRDPTPSQATVAAPASSAPIVIGRDPNEGWGGDVEIPASVVQNAGDSFTVHARGVLGGNQVELEVVFHEKPDAIEIRPIAHTDALLAAMATAWKQPPSKRSMRALRAQIVFLSDEKDPAKQGCHAKAFFDPTDAELFVNWNAKTSMLELFEKDVEYRADVLAALAAR
jgi:hypothetical protein